jgi:hypothetical protein
MAWTLKYRCSQCGYDFVSMTPFMRSALAVAGIAAVMVINIIAAKIFIVFIT